MRAHIAGSIVPVPATAPALPDGAADAPAWIEQRLGPRFRLERELTGGGMSRLFVARDEALDRAVVVKALLLGDDAARRRQRFRREVRLTARLQHPNIIPVLVSHHGSDVEFYCMPFVEGGSLRDRLARHGPMPVPEALRVAHALADALAHAHARGVVHRDVKPANVLLADGLPILIDFGIARPMDSAAALRITATGMTVGTATYMSPEQAVGEAEVDGRADVYALGGVLYELLTGRPPFRGRDDVVLCRRLREPAPRPAALRADLPPAVDDAVARALAPLADDRFPSAAEFAAALECAAAHAAARAARCSWRARLLAGWWSAITGGAPGR